MKDNITKFNTIFKNCMFLMKSSWALKRSIFFVYLGKIIIESIQPFILIIFPKFVLDELTGGKRLSQALLYVLFMILLSLFFNVLSTLINQATVDNNNRLTNAAGNRYSEDFMTIDYKYNESGEALDLAKQFFFFVQPTEFLKNISELLTNMFKIFGCCYVVLYMEPLMLLIIAIVIILNFLFTNKIKKLNYLWEKDQIPYVRRIGYLSNVMTDYILGKEVRINGVSSWLSEKYEKELEAYKYKLNQYNKKEYKLSILNTVVAVFQDVLLYAYFSFKTIAGTLTIGSFSMLIGTTSLFITTINTLFEKLNYFVFLSNHIDSYKKYKALIDTGCTMKGKRLIDKLDKDNITIEFKNVSLRYPNSNNYALKDVSIRINPKEKLSIVGLNGAGKTTFVKLLCRLYEPTQGEILINNINIEEFVYEEYVKLLSVVLQDFKLLAFSIKENIELSGEYDEDRMLDSLEKSGLMNKISKMEKGVETTLYKEFDIDGIEFSGGEGQKLALARALYKDSPIVILDEPTSALDPLAEYDMFNKFNKLVDNKTAIYISHRLSSTRFSDAIAVFHNGKIVEYGNHVDLIKRRGHYAEMYGKQAQYYIEEDYVKEGNVL